MASAEKVEAEGSPNIIVYKVDITADEEKQWVKDWLALDTKEPYFVYKERRIRELIGEENERLRKEGR